MGFRTSPKADTVAVGQTMPNRMQTQESDQMHYITMLLSNPFVSDPRVHAEAKTLTAHGYRVTVIG